MKIGTGIALVALMAAATMTSAFAQSAGADTYKAKCQSCHGAQGIPNPGIAKAMGVKPANDPSVTSISEAQMIADTTNGKGKMPAFKGKLTDEQIKGSVEYFRSLGK
jgi:cytochrome c6